MKAVVYHGVGDIRVDDVPSRRSRIDPTDAIVRITTSAICGTDLHFARGTMPGTAEGRILGHEAVGVVDELGEWARNCREGDRVVVGSTICCGTCSYCRAGYTAQCDKRQPERRHGLPGRRHGPHPAGRRRRGLRLRPGRPVRHLERFHLGATRVIAVDTADARLERARDLGAETVDYSVDHLVQALRDMTRGIDPDRIIDAVGIESSAPAAGPAAEEAAELRGEFDHMLEQVVPESNPQNGHFRPGDAPFLTLQWAVEAIAKAPRSHPTSAVHRSRGGRLAALPAVAVGPARSGDGLISVVAHGDVATGVATKRDGCARTWFE